MAVERIPGEIIYIDWIGDTLDLVCTDVPGELQTAHFFVAMIGASSYCFAMAFPNEKEESFLQGTIESLKFYQGVPKILKPDNTKTASIKNTKDILILNKAYEDLQEFHGTAIIPTSPRKPKGKASVKNHTRWLETHLLERLKGRWFSSFINLNNKISAIIDELNRRPFSNGKGNRKELFEKYDRPALKPLPHESLKVYSYIIKTVPYTYYKQEVTLKISHFDIIICDSTNRIICRHTRAYKPYPKYITLEDHMPASHRYYYNKSRMDGNGYKNRTKSYEQNVYGTYAGSLVHFAMKNSRIKVVMVFCIYAETAQRAFVT